MQWNAGKHAGFMPEDVDGEAWMSIHPDFERWNAEAVVKDKDSSFHYWRRVLQLRKDEKDLFVYGDFEMLDLENRSDNVVAYVRTEDTDKSSKKKAMIIASFSKEDVWWEVPQQQTSVMLKEGQLTNVVSELRNYAEPNEVKGNAVKLRPFEVLVAIAEG